MESDLDKFLKAASENKDIPHLYSNGFTVNVTLGDVTVALKTGEDAVGVLYMSHTIAKTFVDMMGKLLAEYETRTGIQVQTTMEVEARLKGENQ